MSTLSEEEKKRILRERRQAKMAKGKASDRLNSILSKGSSVNANSAVSVLDTASEDGAPTANLDASQVEEIVHDDPEIQDIDSVIQKMAKTDSLNDNSPQPPDMDALFNQIFGGANAANGAGFPPMGGAGTGADGSDNADPFTQMMMQMMGGQAGAAGGNPFATNGAQGFPEASTYDSEMAKYTEYQHQSIKWRFLLVRYLLIIVNFAYHYVNESFFRSSRLVSVRIDSNNTSSFILWFASCEVLVISAYYVLCFSRFQHHVSGNNFIIKLLNMGLMVLPQLALFKQLAITLLGYYDLFSVLLNDIALVVVLFGITSMMN